jgi:hypothetical protein
MSMVKFINSWLNRKGYYKLSDLQVGGGCGLCGKPIHDQVLPKR